MRSKVLNGGRGSGKTFRLICEVYKNKIADLEKENTELNHNKKTIAHLAYCLEEKMKQQINDLEKENARLKKRSEYKHKTCVELAHQANVAQDNLDKAKEIIKGLLSCCRNYPQENAEKMEQVKQFLKEMEE